MKTQVNDFHKAKLTEDKWLVMTALAYWLNTDMAYGLTGEEFSGRPGANCDLHTNRN